LAVPKYFSFFDRFDFSFPRQINQKELKEIENIVNAVITSSYPIHYDYIPLSQAKEIYGLRVVPGEMYPDPVRVLSVGPFIQDLLSEPKKETWKDYSVEFCGGIHLQNTKEAEYFTIVEETAVAKGIRRISAFTKDIAKDVHSFSEKVFSEMIVVENQVQRLKLQKQKKKSVITQESLNEVEEQLTVLRYSFHFSKLYF
jgi:alanyl-tRNA synthetase